VKKIILIILGLGGLALAIYAFSPLLYDNKVSENIEDVGKIQNITPDGQLGSGSSEENEIRELRAGEFQGVGVHSAKGTAKILDTNGRKFVRLENDFEVTNGPDLFVYFGNNGQYDGAAQIAPLKGNVGGQNYEVPENINPEQYSEVWIWCKQFSVPFARSELK
jgi:hypothetical protein